MPSEIGKEEHRTGTTEQGAISYTVGSCGSAGEESACNAGDLGSIPGLEDPLEKENATHSSILAWRIPGTEEPDRLQSMESQRVRHD